MIYGYMVEKIRIINHKYRNEQIDLNQLIRLTNSDLFVYRYTFVLLQVFLLYINVIVSYSFK